MTALAGFHLGFFFAVLQVATYFAVQLHFTATFMGYFGVTLAWMAGVIIFLKSGIKKEITFSTTILVALAAFFILDLVLETNSGQSIKLATLALCGIIIAMPAGYYFREAGRSLNLSSFLCTENNGYVVGFVAATLMAIQWGADFLHYGPWYFGLITWLLLQSEKKVASLLIFIAVIAAYMNGAAGFTFLSLLVYALMFHFLAFSDRQAENHVPRSEPPVISIKAGALLVFLAGFNLLLLQFFVIREFSLILSASEIAIMIVGAAYFSGYSIGYFVSPRISFGFLRGFVVWSFFIHILMIVGLRFMGGKMLASGQGFFMLVLLLFTASFLCASLYSIILPKVVALTSGLDFNMAYRWDLFGALLAGLVLLFIAPQAPHFLWPLYFGGLILMMVLLYQKESAKKPILALVLAVFVFLCSHQSEVSKRVGEDYYAFMGYDNPRIHFSGQSFYHSIDVIDTHHDRQATEYKGRMAFINGIRYFTAERTPEGDFKKDSSSLSEFTYFLAELPAKYLHQKKGQKLNVLILGGGSMTTMARVAPYAQKTTLVEIDPLVVTAAKKSWQDFNQHDALSNATIVVDDAKHFLKNTSEKYDLIILDISAPYYLGTALIHNRDFFALVNTRLKNDGLFSESTQSRPLPKKKKGMGMKILAGVREVFPEWRVIDGKEKPRGEHGYVYASQNLDFSTDVLVEIMKADNKYEGTATYGENSSHFKWQGIRPYSDTDLSQLIDGNINRISERLYSETKSDLSQRPFLQSRTGEYLYLQWMNPVIRFTLYTLLALVFIVAGIKKIRA